MRRNRGKPARQLQWSLTGQSDHTDRYVANMYEAEECHNFITSPRAELSQQIKTLILMSDMGVCFYIRVLPRSEVISIFIMMFDKMIGGGGGGGGGGGLTNMEPCPFTYIIVLERGGGGLVPGHNHTSRDSASTG